MEQLRRGIIEKALKGGKKVFVNGIAVMSGLRGSFSSVDGPFDPAKHKLTVTLKDAKGVLHAVTVEARKKTALVCTFAGTAAKGKATVEVVLPGEEPDTCRFTASRKVSVR